MKYEQNRLRRIILENNLQQYEQHIKISERNLELTHRYLSGESFTELAKEYKIAHSRPHQIVAMYLNLISRYMVKNRLRSVKDFWE